jgi:hypothetical protein
MHFFANCRYEVSEKWTFLESVTCDDAILFQSLLGEFNKEQEAFIREKQGKVSDAAVPPWVGCPNEESLKEEFLTLSTVSARQFVHRFCLITGNFFITRQGTLTL